MNTSTHRLGKNSVSVASGVFKNTLLRNEEKLYSINPQVSKIAATELANIGFLSVDILTKALKSDVNHIAINAANGIRTIGPNAKAAVFDLTGMLRHSDVECREIAAATLGLLRSIPKVSVQALAKALLDSELSVRQYASAALGEFDGNDLSYEINALQRAVKDDDKHVREFAKYALSKTAAI